MKICNLCGNEVPLGVTKCPFCGNQLKPSKVSSYHNYQVLNLKQGMPNREEAIFNLQYNLKILKRKGVRLVKVIHGYGSNGVGGELRFAVREFLQKTKFDNLYNYFVIGEEFQSSSNIGRKLISEFPRLKKDEDFRRKNLGITLIVL